MVAVQFLSVIGGVGLFLYGIKLLSESIQKISGSWLREFLKSMTRNRFRGVLTGFLIAAIIQSSSATTIMVVSFVNAGFMRLVEAILVIMGANVGTTITAWIITLFGFELNITYLLLPFIALSIPFVFAQKRTLKSWGEIVLGFSLMFIAIAFMKENVPVLIDSTESHLLQNLMNYGYFSYFLFLLFGLVLTVVFQSSVSIFVLVLVVSFNGWLNLECAISILLGANVGATIATLIAARKANNTARQAALAHLFFNVFGVIWAFGLIPFWTKLFQGVPFFTNKAEQLNMPIVLSTFHSTFNIVNALFLVGLNNNFTNFIAKIIKSDKKDKNKVKLTHLKFGLLSTPDASIFQARRETIIFAESVRKMFDDVVRVSTFRNLKEIEGLAIQINLAEKEANLIEKEIANYLTKVGEVRLSEANSRRIRALYKMVDDIESIADSNVNILGAYLRRGKSRLEFPERVENNIALMFHMVSDAIHTMVNMLTNDEAIPLSVAMDLERDINNFRDILKSEHIDNLQKGIYNYDVGIIYSDIISQCERIGDYTINVAESFKTFY